MAKFRFEKVNKYQALIALIAWVLVLIGCCVYWSGKNISDSKIQNYATSLFLILVTLNLIGVFFNDQFFFVISTGILVSLGPYVFIEGYYRSLLNSPFSNSEHITKLFVGLVFILSGAHLSFFCFPLRKGVDFNKETKINFAISLFLFIIALVGCILQWVEFSRCNNNFSLGCDFTTVRLSMPVFYAAILLIAAVVLKNRMLLYLCVFLSAYSLYTILGYPLLTVKLDITNVKLLTIGQSFCFVSLMMNIIFGTYLHFKHRFSKHDDYLPIE